MTANGTSLRVRHLRTSFDTRDGLVRAVQDVSFAIPAGRTFALVGESGCGKSVTAYSILRLLPTPPARIEHGWVEFEGRDLLALNERQMRQVRGGSIGMVFQEPMTSLNPVFTCGNQIVEAIRLHDRSLSARAARDQAAEMLTKVGIPDAGDRLGDYPHQLSGGMRQRVMMAMALSCRPRLLIADEPTTALDVTIQAQILDLLRGLQDRTGLSIMLITHDLAVVAETAHVVGVMYASRLVELAESSELFARAMHPYTEGLFRSLPKLGVRAKRLETIPGNVPNPLHFPDGCKFHPRCPRTRRLARQAPAGQTTLIDSDGGKQRVLSRCASEEPSLREVRRGHWCACWEVEGYQSAEASDPSSLKLGPSGGAGAAGGANDSGGGNAS
jgi:oligopeptide/dipeptide ABC transporter ATP-binding protein